MVMKQPSGRLLAPGIGGGLPNKGYLYRGLFRNGILRGLAGLLVLGWIFLASGGLAGAQFNGDFSLHKHALDAENFLDWRAYQPPHGWRRDNDLAPNIFTGTVGSLSQKKFYSLHEIRLEKDFARYGTFLYRQREESFFRPEPIAQEVEFRIGQGVYGSVFGFPHHQKIEGHQGYALAIGKRTDWRFLRLSRLKQFVLFNVENEGDEYFSPNPRMYRLEARGSWARHLYAQADVRREKPTTLVSPAKGQRESYQGDRLDMTLEAHWGPRMVTGIRHRAHKEQRTREPLAGGAAASASQVLRSGWLDLYGVLTLDNGDTLESGGYRGLFENRIRSEAAEDIFDHRLLTDALYLIWDHARGNGVRWIFSFQGGRADRDKADGAFPLEAEDEVTTELKLGLGIVLEEAGSHRIFFNSTWDLDLFQHRQWDGGNVQVQLLF